MRNKTKNEFRPLPNKKPPCRGGVNSRGGCHFSLLRHQFFSQPGQLWAMPKEMPKRGVNNRGVYGTLPWISIFFQNSEIRLILVLTWLSLHGIFPSPGANVGTYQQKNTPHPFLATGNICASSTFLKANPTGLRPSEVLVVFLRVWWFFLGETSVEMFARMAERYAVQNENSQWKIWRCLRYLNINLIVISAMSCPKHHTQFMNLVNISGCIIKYKKSIRQISQHKKFGEFFPP